MRKSDFPPIPPEVPYSRYASISGLFRWKIGGGPELSEDSSTERKTVACYWRCAWIDEAKRIDSEWKEDSANVKAGNNKEGCAVRFSNFNDAFQAAYDNSEAWRLWGESK